MHIWNYLYVPVLCYDLKIYNAWREYSTWLLGSADRLFSIVLYIDLVFLKDWLLAFSWRLNRKMLYVCRRGVILHKMWSVDNIVVEWVLRLLLTIETVRVTLSFVFQENLLMAYQISFDMYDSATQQFLQRVQNALRVTVPLPEADGKKDETDSVPVQCTDDKADRYSNDQLVNYIICYINDTFISFPSIIKELWTSYSVIMVWYYWICTYWLRCSQRSWSWYQGALKIMVKVKTFCRGNRIGM